MKKRIALLSLCFVCGLTYAQESFTDSVRLVKENYINVFIGNDPAKKALVDRLAEVEGEGGFRPECDRAAAALSHFQRRGEPSGREHPGRRIVG